MDSRTQLRTGFTPAVRIRLLEQDADEAEDRMGRHAAKVQADIKALRSTMRVLIGAHVAVVVSIIGALSVLAFK